MLPFSVAVSLFFCVCVNFLALEVEPALCCGGGFGVLCGGLRFVVWWVWCVVW